MTFVVALLIGATFPHQSLADKISGRVEAGAFAATERFSDQTGGSYKNDFALATFRIFFRDSEIQGSNYEFTADVRDKYDFYDKLNREQLKLEASNVVSAHQFNIRKVVKTNSGWGYTLGRQPVPEAGGAFTDGFLFHLKASSKWNFGGFGGLDPRTPGQARIEFDSSANIYGGFFSYQPRQSSWDKSFSMVHSLVSQSADQEVNRQYLFHNLNYQWAKNDRIITFLYLDFVPRTFVQVGSLTYHQDLSEKYYSKISAMGVDSLGYVRLQGVREQLEPAPYQQAQVRLGYRATQNFRMEGGVLHGKRRTDRLDKTDYSITFTSLEAFGPKWDSQWTIGYRDNFVSKDGYIGARLGYYSRLWESYLDVEVADEKYNTTHVTRRPLTTELAASRFLSRRTYITGSFQRSADENVTILSAFMKLGYRFGGREVAPLREGSPDRGSL